MRLKPLGLAPILPLVLAALACNLGGAASNAEPSTTSAPEMSLDEALSVPSEDRRPEVLRLMGAPDAFTLQWQELEGTPVRWEEWSYFDDGARFDFVDGELAWTIDLDPAPDGALYAHTYNPLDFDPSMTIDDVQATFPDQTFEQESLAEADIPSGVALAGDQILLGFDNDRLVYVQTFILAPGGEPLAEAPTAAPSPPTASPSPPAATATSGPAALLADDFDSASSAEPLFGSNVMTFSVEGGEGALTSLVPGGVVPVMYGTPVPADFAAQVDVRFPGAAANSIAGMIFRSDDAADGLAYYYHLVFHPSSGKIGIDVWKDGAFASVGSASVPSGTLHAGAANRLRLEAQGNQFRVFVNDSLVLTASDTRLPGGGIFGLSIVASQSPETVYFDNLRVEALGE